MALWHVQDFVRSLPGGAGTSGATVTIKRESDDTTITTATTDADGFFQKSLSATATTGANSYLLHPGPYYTEVTIGSYTRRHSSRSLGTAGPLHIPAQLFLNRAMGTGIVSSPGSSLNTWAVTVLITANASGNPRIDTIVLEVVPQGEATEGKVTLKVVDGTAAASPVAPTLTQSTALWQFPLADVAVANGAATISQGNITDRRDYVERSTTTVEDDVVALEARVDDLEDGTVPRMDIVATYSATVNPGAIAHGIWSNIAQVNDSSFTFHNGYTEIDATTMVAQAWHSGCAAVQLLVYNSLYSALGTESVMVTAINGTGVSQDPASGTLYIVVTKLVTS
jgi:hypothetical protein